MLVGIPEAVAVGDSDGAGAARSEVSGGACTVLESEPVGSIEKVAGTLYEGSSGTVWLTSDVGTGVGEAIPVPGPVMPAPDGMGTTANDDVGAGRGLTLLPESTVDRPTMMLPGALVRGGTLDSTAGVID
jgi:hypothetical protein